MKVLIDGDACPVKAEAIAISRRHHILVVLVANIHHHLEQEPGVEVLQVDADAEAADLVIANQTQRGDVVVTQDFGLAALALGKGARAISPRGSFYTQRNIEGLLHQRHVARKLRRRGHHTKGPKPFTQEDREKFASALESLISVPDPVKD